MNSGGWRASNSGNGRAGAEPTPAGTNIRVKEAVSRRASDVMVASAPSPVSLRERAASKVSRLDSHRHGSTVTTTKKA